MSWNVVSLWLWDVTIIKLIHHRRFPYFSKPVLTIKYWVFLSETDRQDNSTSFSSAAWSRKCQTDYFLLSFVANHFYSKSDLSYNRSVLCDILKRVLLNFVVFVRISSFIVKCCFLLAFFLGFFFRVGASFQRLQHQSLCLPTFPESWQMWNLLNVSFTRRAGAPVLRSAHKIKQEMMDEPAEAPTTLLFTPLHFGYPVNCFS